MLINTVPDDHLMYIGFFNFIFNITSIVNVLMLSIEKKKKEKKKKSSLQKNAKKLTCLLNINE